MGMRVSNILQTIFTAVCKSFLVIFLSFNLSCTVTPDDLSNDTSIDEILRLADKAKQRKSFEEAGDFYMEADRLYPYSDKSRTALVEAMKTYHLCSFFVF